MRGRRTTQNENRFSEEPKPHMNPGWPERGRKGSPVIPSLRSECKWWQEPDPWLQPCHPERSEGSRGPSSQTLRFAQGDITASCKGNSKETNNAQNDRS